MRQGLRGLVESLAYCLNEPVVSDVVRECAPWLLLGDLGLENSVVSMYVAKNDQVMSSSSHQLAFSEKAIVPSERTALSIANLNRVCFGCSGMPHDIHQCREGWCIKLTHSIPSPH
jgi:hypothetical protein